MKLRHVICLFIALIGNINIYAQGTLSESERQLLIDQIKKELLDSFNVQHARKLEENYFKDQLKISTYVETYYCYDFANPKTHVRPSFLYSFNKHNEVSINLAMLKASYNSKWVRANLGFMAGTYTNANLVNEPGVLKNIFEANVGVKISKKKNVWIDAGIFASHIGFESAMSKDCWNLTRSILAENSPYYESGAKLSYISDNDKFFVSALVLNGWQRIQGLKGNSLPAFGHQLIYKPNAKITLNSSSFIGSDMPDSTRQMRYFHNLYGLFQVSEKFGFTIGFDIGAQQQRKASSNYNFWYSPVVILKYSPTSKINISARGEYYRDANQVIISTGSINGFQTYGYSLNFDYIINSIVMWRIEGRGFYSIDPIFIENNKSKNTNYFLTSCLAISF